jgi:pSer/pThr/pTyr-binding forkhead associated (FHA) protein
MSLEWVLLGLRILATIILYSFLGVAFYIIWRDLKQAETEARAAPQPGYHLRVVASNGLEALTVGEILPLQAETRLGSDIQNTIVLPDKAISAQHARLSHNQGVWWLEDLGSHQGTTLNEAPLAKPVPLHEGDIIGLGELRFRLEAITR